MNLSMVLFLIGILGFILNRKNIILMLISIEIMLLAVTKRVFVILWLFLALHQLLNGSVDNTLMWAMSPWFITGITDGDGSFSFSILKDSALPPRFKEPTGRAEFPGGAGRFCPPPLSYDKGRAEFPVFF